MSRQASPTGLLVLLCVVIFLAMIAVLMLGPLLVELAGEFHTSVAVAGQLVAATAIPWGITAPFVGPVSDTYGKRPMLLIGCMVMALGILGSAIAWNYVSLLAFRILTGVGGGMVPPNCFAVIADVFPPEGRGKAIGWTVSATGIGAALGVAMVAFLLEVGGWRLPFIFVGIFSLILWLLLWIWLPQSQRQAGRSLSFIAHYREVGSSATFWYVLIANSLLNMSFFGVFSYLAAYLFQSYGMTAGETVLPLGLAGLGVIVGGFLGGRVADHRRRLTLLAISSVVSGLLAALVFITPVSPWPTVALAFWVGSMARISLAVTPILLIELAGRSRTTATGLFAVSNQIGLIGGASIGGAMLALGGFPLVGFFGLVAAVLAAVVVRVKVRDSEEFLEQVALRKGEAV